jgi:hypothetical protein
MRQVLPRVARAFLSTVLDYLQKSELKFNSHLPLETDEDRLSAVLRGANMLDHLGFKADDQHDTFIGDILVQGRVFNIDVLRVLICVQARWPTGGPIHKG